MNKSNTRGEKAERSSASKPGANAGAQAAVCDRDGERLRAEARRHDTASVRQQEGTEDGACSESTEVRAALGKTGAQARPTACVRRGEYGLVGVAAAARAVGRSKAWVSLVLNGKRRSRRLMERLRRYGVKVEVAG